MPLSLVHFRICVRYVHPNSLIEKLLVPWKCFFFVCFVYLCVDAFFFVRSLYLIVLDSFAQEKSFFQSLVACSFSNHSTDFHHHHRHRRPPSLVRARVVEEEGLLQAAQGERHL